MINSANNYAISTILDSERDLKYVIPKYQREYTWGKWNWESIFDDIYYNDSGHFLGSIICINRNVDAMETTEMELVDGQQRLTTISVLLAAIYSWIKENSDPDDDDIRNEIFNLKNRLVQKKDKKTLKLEPSFQRNNHADYKYCLSESGILQDVEYPNNAGNRRVVKMYRYFMDRLNLGGEDLTTPMEVHEVVGLLRKLNNATLVKIEVSNHSDAFTLFETLNNRGVPLSALDLIKNKLLAEMERKKINTIDENFIKWSKMMDNLSDDYSTQERYVRHYYNAFKSNEKIQVPKINQATRSKLIQIYNTLIDRDPQFISNDLYNHSLIYNRLINPANDQNSTGLASALSDLERISGVPSYAYLMFLISKYESIGNEELVKIISILVNYFVRRNLTDIPPTRDLDRIIIDLIERTNSGELQPTPGDLASFLKAINRYASDELFKSKLEGSIYEDNVGVTRFILCKIEELKSQTNEIYTDLWKRNDKGIFIWSIEHIFPQGKNIPDSWVNMVAKGDRDLANQYRDEYVHKLGNLTISGYNSQLSNMSFERKRDRTSKDGKFVGYKNGLYLNKDVVGVESWTIQNIKSRTEKLVSLAADLFKI